MRISLPCLTSSLLALALLPLDFGGMGCAAPRAAAPVTSPVVAAASSSSTVDAIGARPGLGAPKAYTPPTPRVLEIPDLPKVWLMERHALPLVGMVVVVPHGSAADPKGKGGLASLTAELMQQGAGDRGALEISRAAEQLGAQIEVGATFDASTASLAVMKSNFDPALQILADVVARPRMEEAEWKRIQPLWVGDLKNRAYEPREVAELAGLISLFGQNHPYGHPPAGTLAQVESLQLDDVKKFHQKAWRPDQAVIVLVGDVTEAEAREMLTRAFKGWKSKGNPSEPVAPPPPGGTFPRVVLVDRPGSPQTMLRLVSMGPSAADPLQAALRVVNVPLGGSFTSRLNQNLREDKGYTYGARSSVPFTRGPGALVAAASVEKSVTGAALSEMLKELDNMAASGPSMDEIRKARSSSRNDDVETYEGVFATADRLALLAGLGLPPDWDGSLATARDGVDGMKAREAAGQFSGDRMVIVAVGDRSVVEPQLKAMGLPTTQLRDPEGKKLK